MATTSQRVDVILERFGTTYAQQTGIRLADKPAAHELFKSGFCTPQHMADATWQQRAEALRRDHYRRYGKREPPCSAMAPSFCESATAATYASYAIAPTQSTNSACFYRSERTSRTASTSDLRTAPNSLGCPPHLRN